MNSSSNNSSSNSASNSTSNSAHKSPSNPAANFSQWEYRIIALAGVAQCAALVHELANKSTMPSSEAAACINSLLVLNPGSVLDIYPNVSHLNPGLIGLQDMFSNERVRRHSELVRYTLGLLVLRNKLDSNTAMQSIIRERLQHILPVTLSDSLETDDATREVCEMLTERTFEQLAGIYQDTISTLPYRIQVLGKVEHLKHDLTVNRIRALLLAGIRSAVLWHQLGGRRWQLIFYRKRIRDTAVSIRRKLIVSV